MPYKLMTSVDSQDQSKFYDVIDPKLSRSKKVLRLFPDEETAEYFAEKQLKKKEGQYRIVEVENAYEYDLETGGLWDTNHSV